MYKFTQVVHKFTQVSVVPYGASIFSSPLVPSLVPRDEAPVCSSCWVAGDKLPRSPADSAMFSSCDLLRPAGAGNGL